MNYDTFFNGHTLFSRAWSLTVQPDGLALIGRVNSAMKALAINDRIADYKLEIQDLAEHVCDGLYRANNLIKREVFSDRELLDLAYRLAVERAQATFGQPVEYSRYATILRAIGPDIDFVRLGGTPKVSKAIERSGLYEIKSDWKQTFIQPRSPGSRPSTYRVLCWPAKVETPKVQILEDLSPLQLGAWLRDAASPFVSEYARVSVRDNDTNETLVNASIIDGKWVPQEEGYPLAAILRPWFGHIGYIIATTAGRFKPIVALPHVMSGEDDAVLIAKREGKTLNTLAEALSALDEIALDVDFVYKKPITSMMGMTWLSQLTV